MYSNMDNRLLGNTIELLPWELLENITKRFSEERKIGSGGYGAVYKGVHKNGQEIAVKKLYHMPGLDDKQFQNELGNLARLHHQNIVRLVGYSYEERDRCVEYNGKLVFATMIDRAICLEYLHNGSLENHLSKESYGLPWCRRYEIIKGICEGLKYLHERGIFHLDLKPANILLDENMVPKIADFGLSRLFSGSRQSHTTNKFIGTLGYVPPEYIEKGKISDKFDVFSLGVIITGIMTGPDGYSKQSDMSSQDFIELVQENWRNKYFTGPEEEWGENSYADVFCQQVKKCIEIALNCVEANRHKRPSIGDIIYTLNEMECLIEKSYSALFVVHPQQLCFPFEPDKLISCPLHLTNKTHLRKLFRIRPNKPKMLFVGSLCGVVPARSTCTYVLTMHKQQLPRLIMDNVLIQSVLEGGFDDDTFFKGDSSVLSWKGFVIHDEVRKMMTTSACDSAGRPTIEILSLGCAHIIDVHPTEPWILTAGWEGFAIVNYQTQASSCTPVVSSSVATYIGDVGVDVQAYL